MTDELCVGMAGADITPRFHPQFGAWGTTPSITDVDLPLLSRCVALRQGNACLLWYGSDLVGASVPETDAMRDEVAGALGLVRHHVIWSTSQTHSSGAVPGSKLTGSSITDVVASDAQFAETERKRLMQSFIDMGREAFDRLQPAQVWAGRGYCDSMSYNTRFPLPTGGVKFSRHHAEGLQSGKFYDATIGLLRFDDRRGKPMGAIFNFCCHPATMINGSKLSPDWVGTARRQIENELNDVPAMFVQGMCGDVNCRQIFGTPEQAQRNGDTLGRAATRALSYLSPVRGEPLSLYWQTTELPCRPMYTQRELETAIAERRAFIEELKSDPHACWFCGINAPEFFTVAQKTTLVNVQLQYLEEGLRILKNDIAVRDRLPITLGALRIGDVAAFLSPGENFTATGRDIRLRSPFSHTLICGDTNGVLGYIGDDEEIARGGYETDSFWKMLYIDGFRLAPAQGSVRKITQMADELWLKL